MSQQDMITLGFVLVIAGVLGFIFMLGRAVFVRQPELEWHDSDVVVPLPYETETRSTNRSRTSLMLGCLALALLGVGIIFVNSAVVVPYYHVGLTIEKGKISKILQGGAVYHLVPLPDSVVCIMSSVQASSAVTDTIKTADNGLVAVSYSYVWKLDENLLNVVTFIHPRDFAEIAQRVAAGPVVETRQVLTQVCANFTADYLANGAYKDWMGDVALLTNVRVGYDNPIRVRDVSIYKVTVIKPGLAHPQRQPKISRRDASQPELVQELEEFMARQHR